MVVMSKQLKHTHTSVCMCVREQSLRPVHPVKCGKLERKLARDSQYNYFYSVTQSHKIIDIAHYTHTHMRRGQDVPFTTMIGGGVCARTKGIRGWGYG